MSDADQGRQSIGTAVSEYYELELMKGVEPERVKIVEDFISLGPGGIAALCYFEVGARDPRQLITNVLLAKPDGEGVLARLFGIWPQLKNSAVSAAQRGQPDWVRDTADRVAESQTGLLPEVPLGEPQPTRTLQSKLLQRITEILGEGEPDVQATITELITRQGFQGLLCVLKLDELGMRGMQVHAALRVVKASGLYGKYVLEGLIDAVENKPEWLIASVRRELGYQGHENTVS